MIVLRARGQSLVELALVAPILILLAMSVMMMVPILIMFFFGQRYFVRGVVMSGIKG